MTDERPIRLKDSHTMLFGLKGAGKSNLLQYLLRHHSDRYSSSLLYDVCREHESVPCGRYVPTHRRGDEAVAELDEVAGRLVTDTDRAHRPELLVVEEVNRMAPNGKQPPASLYDLIDLMRHYGTGLLGVARRPAQVHTDLVELADHLLIFRLTGKNDRRRLEEEVDGLGDTVRNLDRYHFVHVRPDRSYRVMAPVREMDTTGRL